MTKLVLRLASVVAMAGMLSLGTAYVIHPARSAAVTARPGAAAPIFTAKDIAGEGRHAC
jgi:hypothetical protein